MRTRCSLLDSCRYQLPLPGCDRIMVLFGTSSSIEAHREESRSMTRREWCRVVKEDA